MAGRGAALAAALGLAALCAAPPTAAAQQLDVRDDPSICTAALSSVCLDTLGAGAVAAPDSARPSNRACAEQLAIYKACLSYASGGATRGPIGTGVVAVEGAHAGSLPIEVQGVLTPRKRDRYAFSHAGGRVRVSTTETAAPALVSLRTAADDELIVRTSKIGGGERVYTQCLPPGEYLLGVEARSRGTAYRVVVSAMGEC